MNLNLLIELMILTMTYDNEDYNYFIECNCDVKQIIIYPESNNVLTVYLIPNDSINFSKFKNYIFEKYNLIRKLTVFQIFIEHYKFISFPEQINQIHLKDYQEFQINLNNLPKQLKHLIIETNQPCDIMNLPNQLEILELCGKNIKFNLNYLPESLKEFNLTYIDSNISYYPINNYTLEELYNLPQNLKVINICGAKYNSSEELFKSYKTIQY